MSSLDKTIEQLRAALSASPDNIALRQHLAETLLQAGYGEEAEAQFRDALKLSPGSTELLIGLANCYFQQSKNSHAMVIVEDLISSRDTPAAAHLLHARLLIRRNDIKFAVAEYEQAIDMDESLRDEALENHLGIAPDDESTSNEELVDGRLRAGGAAGSPIDASEKPTIDFTGVGGMDELKEEIRLKIIYPLQHVDMYEAYGKTVGGGIMMYGPPGCGKTHLARATAGEINADFISVGINEVLDMWIGQSEHNLHEYFETARRRSPCVLFFDEVDALGASRTDMRTSAGRQMINQFLAELDGAQSSNEGVLVLAATNAPWSVDSAFRRPGRFDRILFVPPPDSPARAAITRIMLKGKPCDNVDHEMAAQKMEGFSGADIMAVVDLTIEEKLQIAMKKGRPEPITTRDIIAAAKSLKPSTREWFASARNYARFANASGLYDDVLKYLGEA